MNFINTVCLENNISQEVFQLANFLSKWVLKELRERYISRRQFLP